MISSRRFIFHKTRNNIDDVVMVALHPLTVDDKLDNCLLLWLLKNNYLHR